MRSHDFNELCIRVGFVLKGEPVDGFRQQNFEQLHLKDPGFRHHGAIVGNGTSRNSMRNDLLAAVRIWPMIARATKARSKLEVLNSSMSAFTSSGLPPAASIADRAAPPWDAVAAQAQSRNAAAFARACAPCPRNGGGGTV